MRGEPLGSLHGLPVAIKDITPTAGIRTTFASPLYKDYVPTEDAEVVRRLKAAGAIMLAKTNTPEFACGANTNNVLFGPTRNPWNPALSPAGSSGGSAVAVATGMVPIAQGTDFGCSIRIPAAFCGIVGIAADAGSDAQLSDAARVGSRSSEWPAGARRRGCRAHARRHRRLQPPVADLGRAAVAERACGDPAPRGRQGTAHRLRLRYCRYRRRCRGRRDLPRAALRACATPAQRSSRSNSMPATAAIRIRLGAACGWSASSISA